ncbi:MAG: hypothetical protein WA871_14065 [Candidatus Acidiferrales bacterium]
MTRSSEAKNTPKVYKSPELTVYGPIRELTLKGTGHTHEDHNNRTTVFFT